MTKLFEEFLDISSRWYFIPLVYLIICVILFPNEGFLFGLLYLPYGINYFFPKNYILNGVFYIINFSFIGFSMFYIPWIRTRKNNILKILIITVLILLLLSAYGCVKLYKGVAG